MNILADTCFWISLCDSSENDHIEVQAMVEKIFADKCHRILVPYPVLYETLCSEMVKRRDRVLFLTKYFDDVVKVPDAEYVNEAYKIVKQQADLCKGTASMTDISIMLMAKDIKNNVKGILTRNGRDFSEFCRNLRIPMIENMAILEAV